MAWTKFNNVTLTSGSREVTVNDGTSVAEILAGFDLVKDGLVYELDTPSAGNLMLVDPWPNSTEASASIKVRQTHAPIASQIHQAIQRLSANSDTFEDLKEGAFLDVVNGLEGGTLQATAFKQLATDQEALNGVADKIPNALQVAKNRKRKNYIVNPSMAVSQENGDGPNSISASFIYGADQHRSSVNSNTGATIQVSRSGSGLKVEATTAATDLSSNFDVQADLISIESQNVAHLNSKNVTLSLDVETNWTGKLPIRIAGVINGTVRSYVVDVAVTSGVRSRKSITVPFEVNTVDRNDNTLGLEVIIGGCNEGTLQTTSSGTWVNGFPICTDQSTQWVKTAGNYVEITAVKLEEGSTPTAFEPNSYAYDLAECQRYGFLLDTLNTMQVLGSGFRFTTDKLRFSTVLPVAMRDTLPAIEVKISKSFVAYGNGSSFTVSSVDSSILTTGNSLAIQASCSGITMGAYSVAFNGAIFINARL